MPKSLFLIFPIVAILLGACSTPGSTRVSPTVVQVSTSAPTAGSTAAATFTSALISTATSGPAATATAQALPTNTAVPPATATAAPSVAPTVQASPTASASAAFSFVQGCSADSSDPKTSICRVLLGGAFQQVRVPAHIGWYFDYSPASHSILFAMSDETRGAGPSTLSVHDLAVLDIASGKVTQIFKDPVVVKALWAPNGSDLAYLRATRTTYELRVLTAKGEDRRLANDVPTTFSFSPAADQIVFARESHYPGLRTAPGLYVVPTAGGRERKLSNADRAGAGGIEERVAWSPDGKYFLMPVSIELHLVATNGSVAFPLVFDTALAKEPWYQRGPSTPASRYGPVPERALWDPDGQHLVGMTYTDCGEAGCLTNVVYLGLDLGKKKIVSGKLISKGRLLTWDKPGDSVWIESYETNDVKSFPLPR